ncbi:MAG: TnpV protein [Eubacterium sp.]|nr:TnpV protein [Eubacterium sp.]
MDISAKEQHDLFVKLLAKKQGVTKQLKAENQMLWVQMTNNITYQGREIMYKEILCI